MSDYYDGKIARKYNVVSAHLRQADSIADTVYTVAAFASLWFIYPTLLTEYYRWIILIIALELIRYIFDWFKFKRGASYHAYSAKLFGFTIFLLFFAVVGFEITSPFIEICIFWGIYSEIEGLFMSFILPQWTYDVKHIGVAWKMRYLLKKSLH